jgi:hypothetical protein
LIVNFVKFMVKLTITDVTAEVYPQVLPPFV